VLLFFLSLLASSARGEECRNFGRALSAKASVTVLQTASSSGVVHLENSQSGDASLNLTAGPFVSQTMGGIVSGAVAFAAGDGSGAPPKTLPPGASVDVLATITNESTVGLSVANLFNAGKCIGQLKAVRYDAPFNFTVEGDGAANSPLRIEDRRDVVISLKNNDDLTYPITPSLYLDGEEVAATPAALTVRPNSPVLVRFKAPTTWFEWGTWFRPKSAAIRIVVRPTRSAFGDGAGDRTLTSRFIAVNAQLAALSTGWMELVSFIVVFIVLLLGGVASLATNSLLPSTLKKLSYKKKLIALADAISGVSGKVDPRLPMLLSVERLRLFTLLASSNPLSTDLAGIFQQVDTGLASLSKRVTTAQRLGELHNQFELQSSSYPPSISDKVFGCLQEAANELSALWVTDKIIDNANLALDSAEQTLKTFAKADVLAKDIALRHMQLLARFKLLPKDAFTPFVDALPGIFDVFTANYDDANPILPGNFIQIDDSIARVNVALDAIYVYATTKDTHIENRLKARNEKLLQLLGTRDWRTLTEARDLVEQMRENTYLEDLIEALRERKARIVINPQVPRPYVPMELSIYFDNCRYNHSNALEQLACNWNCGDGIVVWLPKKGWSVWHFYITPGETTITAGFPQVIAAAPDNASDGMQFQSQFVVHKALPSFSTQYWFAAGLQFAIVFFLALVGLVGGARDQLAKLDVIPALIAVFLLGFGADTIKNVLARKDGQPSPSPAK